MRTRPFLAAAVAAAALAVTPLATGTAQAKSLESIDKTTFDAAATQTASAVHLGNATSGELGGYLDLTIIAQDGALPTVAGDCEVADVDAAVTVAPGDTFTVRTTGEICAQPYSRLVLSAAYDEGDLQYTGTAHRKVKVVGAGFLSASNGLFLGWGGAFSGQVRW